MERKELFRALVGSHNYNLNTESSDKDYKVFVMPTFEDLYKGNTYSKSIIGEKEDLDIHDIRKLINLFFKSNINFIEVLYSTDIKISDSLPKRVREIIEEIFSMKKEIVKMNLPYLYNACGGMHLNKMKNLIKGTEGTQHLVEKYGYDTKQALHAFRSLDFIRRFAVMDFEDFEYAMTYGDLTREYMLEIKNGKYSVEKFENLMKLEKMTYDDLKAKYYAQEVDEATKEKLEQLLMELVKVGLGIDNNK